MNDKVVLVNDCGESIGLAGKLEAHQKGLLHLAFSLMIFREQRFGSKITRQYLLQKRANTKYHCAGLWSNTCCSHPYKDEGLVEAVQRRVRQELGITQQLNLQEVEPLYYRADMPNGLIEHEYDHIFVCEDKVLPFSVNPDEVDEWAWVDGSELKARLRAEPSRYTPWLPLVMEKVEQYGCK